MGLGFLEIEGYKENIGGVNCSDILRLEFKEPERVWHRMRGSLSGPVLQRQGLLAAPPKRDPQGLGSFQTAGFVLVLTKFCSIPQLILPVSIAIILYHSLLLHLLRRHHVEVRLVVSGVLQILLSPASGDPNYHMEASLCRLGIPRSMGRPSRIPVVPMCKARHRFQDLEATAFLVLVEW